MRRASRAFVPASGAAIFFLAGMAAALASGLSPSQERGRGVYTESRGEGGPIVARLGGSPADVPAEVLTCVDCHGRAGKGSLEGGVAASDIRWDALTSASRRAGTEGRDRPAYDRSAVAAAVTRGVDPAGKPLHPAMPRYRMSAQDLEDLLDYLQVLGRETAPGVAASEIAIGAFLPRSGPLSGAGEAVAETLEAFFRKVGEAGGINGRRPRLVVADSAADGGVLGAIRSLEAQGVFCLLGSLAVSEAEAEQAEREAAIRALPLIAPVGVPVHREVPPNPYVFHLMPALGDQVRLLVDHALGEAGASVALAAAEDALGAEGRRAFENQMGLHGAGPAAVVPIPSGAGHADGVVEALARSLPSQVVVIGPPREVVAATVALRAASWRPRVLTLAALSGKRILELSPEAAEGVVLAYPGPLPEEGPTAFTAFEGFLGASAVKPRHVGFQMVAFAGGQVLVEGLKRTGRSLSREGLVAALESIKDFPSAFVAPLSFGPNRRTGSRSAVLVRPDPAGGRFVSVEPRREPRIP